MAAQVVKLVRGSEVEGRDVPYGWRIRFQRFPQMGDSALLA
jgi:hypothetical protein